MLDKAVQVVCARAGWRVPPADDKKGYSFSLEGGISFSLSSPDCDRLLARSTLLAPAAGQELSADTLEAVMRITPARFARLAAVTSLDPESGALELHAFAPGNMTEEEQGDFVEDFLNELAFWKAQPVLRGPENPGSSLFSARF